MCVKEKSYKIIKIPHIAVLLFSIHELPAFKSQ